MFYAIERAIDFLGNDKVNEIVAFVEDMMKNKGNTELPHNQLPIVEIPANIREAIFSATDGRIDVDGKRYALEASKLYHEIKSHNDRIKEESRGQKSYTEDNIFEIIEAMIKPDIVEDISRGDVLDQRNVFAIVKINDNCVIVVLSVGGKRNPNITPQQILFFSRQKWVTMLEEEKTIREVLYGESKKRGIDSDLLENIKRNRVTVAHCES